MKYAPVVELADTMDLGDVTLVKGFCAILAADILRQKQARLFL